MNYLLPQEQQKDQRVQYQTVDHKITKVATNDSLDLGEEILFLSSMLMIHVILFMLSWGLLHSISQSQTGLFCNQTHHMLLSFHM